MKQSLAIIGYPLRHSISPQFQQAALDYYGLDIEYEVWETNPLQLAAAVGELRRPGNLGANVTIPFKEHVVGMMDDLDQVAGEIGAVNTVVKREDLLAGYNTDAPGFLRALREDGGFEPRDRVAVVLGAGGAARAVCYALLTEGVARLTIVNRTIDNAEALAEALRDMMTAGDYPSPKGQVAVEAFESARAVEELGRCDLVVNCTPLGMKHGGWERRSPLRAEQIAANVLVCDLVYNPAETPLLKEAARAGARILGGLPMLVYQGAASFELWTGKVAPVEVMFSAARAALE